MFELESFHFETNTARSPDLTIFDYFLWGTLKNRIYAGREVENVEDLRLRILNDFATMQQIEELLIREVEFGISNYENERSSSSPDCDCLPACTSLTYNAEYSQGHYEWEKLFQAFRVNFSEFPGVQMTRLTIFFKEQQFITSERNELYGQTDFLANCGGILGLFTGFSVLSIIEIVYFLSLRLMCNVNRHGRRYWSGSAKLLKDAKVND